MSERPDNQPESFESAADFFRRTRSVLARIASDGEGESLDRREVLKRLGVSAAAAGVAATTAMVGKEWYDDSQEAALEAKRSVEFSAEVSGFEAATKLHYDEVVFVDKSGAPLEVVALEAVTITRDGELYLLSPGPVDEYGILTQGIAGEWLSYQRNRLYEEYPDQALSNNELTVHSVYGQFAAALKDTTEPSLAEKIKAHEITTYEDIIRYFAEKPVLDAPEYTRLEYVTEKIEFREFDEETKKGVHPVAALELRRLIGGLCAQESHFHNGYESSSNAHGIFQQKEDVLKVDYQIDLTDGRDRASFMKLATQVAVAGKHLSRGYARLQEVAGPLAMEQLRALHPDEAVLQKELLVPLAINAYNAGPDRMGEAVRRYFEVPAHRTQRLIGRDLFLAIADFAEDSTEGLLSKYGPDARTYVTRIYAQANILADE